MTDIHVPRENEPGEYYGHPAIYIGPRGNPSGRSWAVYVADGGAHDRHTVKTLVDTEREAEAIAADFIGNMPDLSRQGVAESEACSHLSTCFPVAFHHLFSWQNLRNPLKTKALSANLFTFAGKINICVFLHGIISGGSLPHAR